MAEHEQTQPDKLALDKLALRKSHAGMRFIAQMHIYNMLEWERLETFIAESYHADMLQQASVSERLGALNMLYEKVGRLKVKQVVGTNEHHAIVVMEAESSEGFFYVEMKVEEDYPHKVTFFLLQRMQPAN